MGIPELLEKDKEIMERGNIYWGYEFTPGEVAIEMPYSNYRGTDYRYVIIKKVVDGGNKYEIDEIGDVNAFGVRTATRYRTVSKNLLGKIR